MNVLEKQAFSSFIVFGLGPIGIEIIRSAYQNNPLSIIGAVDIDPQKVGKNISTFIDGVTSNVQVVSSINELQTSGKNPIALHATGSNLQNVWNQIKELLDNGFSVVSTCEQLSYPWERYPELSKEIDVYAKERGLSVIGTGINPGFIMDTVALCFSSVLTTLEKVSVYRSVDVSKRRIPLQKKVGIGMSKAEFEALAILDQIGHVGLEESVRLIAHGLNWELVEVDNSIVPTIATKRINTPLTELQIGDVSGLHQISQGRTSSGKEIYLELTMAADVQQEDKIVIKGNETQTIVIPNGIFGDTATAAMVINTAKLVNTICKPGLLTMAEIGLPRNIQQSQPIHN